MWSFNFVLPKTQILTCPVIVHQTKGIQKGYFLRIFFIYFNFIVTIFISDPIGAVEPNLKACNRKAQCNFHKHHLVQCDLSKRLIFQQYVSIEINKCVKYNKCRKENSIYQKECLKIKDKGFMLPCYEYKIICF